MLTASEFELFAQIVNDICAQLDAVEILNKGEFWKIAVKYLPRSQYDGTPLAFPDNVFFALFRLSKIFPKKELKK